ncbi:MAG TPA: lytic murein transglycosylase B [Gammaproteobacteria bacterium]|nr:lytic murein transglycosylase B [Gammaproteobacteria bacterium]
MKKFHKTLTCILFSLMFFSPSAFSLQTSNYKQLDKMFDEVASKTAYSVTDLEALFQKVEIQPRIIEIMDRPAESMPWYQYRKIFLTEKNISKGAEYWIKHADTLARAEKEFGVPPEIIVATLGVETRYGTNTGGFRVIDALSTLGLEYPRRGKYFTKELKNFLLLSDENKLDPLAVTGSYAGAIGLPQFMPSSYRAFAVDFNGDGYSDLVNSAEDAIGSIASYYNEHGWKPGQPVSWSTKDVSSKAKKMVVKKRKTDRVLSDLLRKGFVLQEQLDPETRVGLIKLEGEKGPEYRVAFDNFFVITRYNTSELYATAVQLLGEEIKARVLASK